MHLCHGEGDCHGHGGHHNPSPDCRGGPTVRVRNRQSTCTVVLTPMSHDQNLTHTTGLADRTVGPAIGIRTGQTTAMAHAYVLTIWSDIARSNSASCWQHAVSGQPCNYRKGREHCWAMQVLLSSGHGILPGRAPSRTNFDAAESRRHTRDASQATHNAEGDRGVGDQSEICSTRCVNRVTSFSELAPGLDRRQREITEQQQYSSA
jgi:hypothetical protein